MTEHQQKLSAAEVVAAGVGDWRQVFNRLRARFRTGDLATGLALVARIGEAAVDQQAHPDLVVTSTAVVVTLWSPDVRGITARDLDVARRIGTAAAELGIVADVTGLTQLELGLDTAAGDHLAPYYAALLGGEVQRGEPVDASGQVPTVWWQDPHEVDAALALPEQPFQQRWHLDVWVPHDEGASRVQAVIGAGGRLVSDAAAPSYWVVEDADGNRSCICTPYGR